MPGNKKRTQGGDIDREQAFEAEKERERLEQIQQERLAQQKAEKAREEARERRERNARVELLKLRQGQTVESPTLAVEQPHVDPRPKDFKGKLKNFWSYYKWWVLIGIVAVGVFGWLTVDTIQRSKKDLTVLVATTRPDVSQHYEEIQSFLERYCEDFDGDGNVKVELFTLEFGDGANSVLDPQYQLQNRQKLQSELAAGNALLILADDTVVEEIIGGDDVFLPLQDVYPDMELHGAHDALLYLDTLKGFHRVFQGEDAEMFDGMNIALRNIDAVVGGSREKLEKRLSNAKNVLERIMEDRPAEEAE